MPGCPPPQGETSATTSRCWSTTSSAHHPEHHERRMVVDYIWSRPPPVRSRNGGRNASPNAGTSQSLEDWYVIVNLCCTVSYEVNAFLLQYALNRLNILLILAGDANVAIDLAVTVFKNFELKRDTIQAENYMPAR